ncbi:hypothetical protein ABBQ38_011922 [Trebouxia sp. C0009 RCD-2024]
MRVFMVTSRKLSEDGFNLRCKGEYDDRVVVRAVIQDFAKCFSLHADLCTAWHFKTRLEGDEVLTKVAENTGFMP